MKTLYTYRHLTEIFIYFYNFQPSAAYGATYSLLPTNSYYSLITLTEQPVIVVQVELSFSPPITDQLLAGWKNNTKMILTVNQPNWISRCLQIWSNLNRKQLSLNIGYKLICKIVLQIKKLLSLIVKIIITYIHFTGCFRTYNHKFVGLILWGASGSS